MAEKKSGPTVETSNLEEASGMVANDYARYGMPAGKCLMCSDSRRRNTFVVQFSLCCNLAIWSSNLTFRLCVFDGTPDAYGSENKITQTRPRITQHATKPAYIYVHAYIYIYIFK